MCGLVLDTSAFAKKIAHVIVDSQVNLPWRCHRHHVLEEPYVLLSVVSCSSNLIKFVSSLPMPQLSSAWDYMMHGNSIIPFGILLEMSLSATASAMAGADPAQGFTLACAIVPEPVSVRRDNRYQLACTLVSHTGQLSVANIRGTAVTSHECMNATALVTHTTTNKVQEISCDTCLVSNLGLLSA